MAIKQDETLPAPGDTGEDGAAGGSGTKDSGPRMETRYRVKINSGPDVADKQQVPLTLKGKTILLARDTEVLITKPFLEILEHAEEGGYEVPTEQGVITIPPVRRYAYSVFGEVQVPEGSLDTAPEKNANHATA